LINGDFEKHGIAQEPADPDNYRKTWDLIKDAMDKNLKTIRDSYPDTDLFPTIGNNDVVVHN